MASENTTRKRILASLFASSIVGALFWCVVSERDSSGIPAPETTSALESESDSESMRAGAGDQGTMPPSRPPVAAEDEPESTTESVGPTGTIRGIVRDDETRPVSGASVEAAKESGDNPWSRSTELVRSVISAATGEFSLEDLPVGSYTLRVRSPSHRPESVSDLELTADQVIDVAVELRAGLGISGRVVDPVGRPVVGADVECQPALQRRGPIVFRIRDDPLEWAIADFRTRTDDAGAFQLRQLPSGNRRLIVRHPDWAPSTLDRVASGSRGLTIRMARGGEIRGKVHGPDGEPIPDAEVMAYSTEESFLGATRRNAVVDRTDESGTYHLAWVPAGTVEIAVQPAGYSKWVSDDLIVEEGESVADFDIELAAPVNVTGRVVNARGEPVEAATVWVSSRTENVSSRSESDADGRFSNDELQPGSDYRLRVDHREYLSFSGDPFDISETVDLGTIELLEGLSIEGRIVTVDQQPVKTASIDVFQRAGDGRSSVRENEHADADGEFAILGLPDGEYEVRVTSPGFGRRTSESVRLDHKTKAPFVVVLLGEGSSYRGRVVDDLGAPVPGARVEAGYPQGLFSATYADSTGRFTFRGLVEGHVHVPLRAVYGGLSSSSELVMPDTPVDLVLERRGDIVGRVSDAEAGEAITSFRVYLDTRSGAHYGEGTVFRDASGSFTLTDVASGKYVLAVHAASYGVREVEVELRPGERRRVDVELSAGTRIEGAVIDDAGRPVGAARVFAIYEGEADDGPRPRGGFYSTDKYGQIYFVAYQDDRADEVRTDSDGHFELPGLRDGVASLRVQHPQFLEGRSPPFEIVGGRPLVLEPIRLEPGSGFAGTVSSHRGEPVGRGLIRIDCMQLTATAPPKGDGDAGDDSETPTQPWLHNCKVKVDPDGTYRRTGLPAGRYRVSYWEDTSSGREVRVGADEILTVDLRLKPDTR